MDFFNLASLLIVLASLFAFMNLKTFKLPTTIGVMLFGLIFSLGLILLQKLGFNLQDKANIILASVHFERALLDGMLSFLLFVGALHINLEDLLKQKGPVLSFASIGLVVSTLIIGYSTYFILPFLGIELSLLYCLIFGALISPTDPIAVLALLKQAKAPKSLETKIAGESLFNDGVGVVLFIILIDLLKSNEAFSVSSLFITFAHEALGGAFIGLITGYIAYRLIMSVDDYKVEILLSLGLVMGGYSLAQYFHCSGPIAMVISGLLIGNQGRRFAMSKKTKEHLDTFWELIDEILNAVLFLLIGLELIVIFDEQSYWLAGLIMIPIVLAARYISIGIPVQLLKRIRSFSPHITRLMTWSGLRGGISIALALSLPEGKERNLILTITYMIVIFSIVVQGLSFSKLLRKSLS